MYFRTPFWIRATDVVQTLCVAPTPTAPCTRILSFLLRGDSPPCLDFHRSYGLNGSSFHSWEWTMNDRRKQHVCILHVLRRLDGWSMRKAKEGKQRYNQKKSELYVGHVVVIPIHAYLQRTIFVVFSLCCRWLSIATWSPKSLPPLFFWHDRSNCLYFWPPCLHLNSPPFHSFIHCLANCLNLLYLNNGNDDDDVDVDESSKRHNHDLPPFLHSPSTIAIPIYSCLLPVKRYLHPCEFFILHWFYPLPCWSHLTSLLLSISMCVVYWKRERAAFCYYAHARACLHKARILCESLCRIRSKKGREGRKFL